MNSSRRIAGLEQSPPRSGFKDRSGNGWLTWCVGISALLLGFAWLGINLPNWTVYVADPPAWVANATGLTRWARGFFPGMESAISYLPGLVHLPILGSLILWLLYGAFSSKMGKVLGLIWSLAGCIALQFTIAQAFLHIADHERAAGHTRTEGAALAKVLYILEETRDVAMFHDTASTFGFLARLGELQAYPEVRRLFPPPPPVHMRVGQIGITLESDLQPVPVPAFFTRGTRTMAEYQQTLTEALHKALPGTDLPVDLGGLEQLGICDLRLFVGMQLTPALFSAGFMMKEYPDVAHQFFQSPTSLTVHIHSSADELLSSFQGLVHSSSKLPNGALLIAYYDRQTRILHLAVNDADWRGYNVSMLRSFASAAARAGTVTYESQTEFLAYSEKSWLTPMSHESWHFMLQNMPGFNGLPPALEEGMASFAESISESVGEAASQNARLFDQYPGNRNPERERLMAAAARRCPPMFQTYWQRLLSAQQHRALVPVDSLLQIDSPSTSEQPDLLYAEGWALALRVWFSPQLFADLRTALARRSNAGGQIPLEDRPFWNYLDSELLSFARDVCESRN